jgi:long-chain acyl-CoA synthetase
MRSTLPALIDEAVAAHGPRTAIEFRERPITFEALGHEVNRFGAALMRDGMGPGTALALYLPNTPYHPFAFFGGAKAGVRLAHLSPIDAERELAHKLTDSGARVLVTTNIGHMLPMALKLLDMGLVDRVIVGEDEVWGPSPAPTSPIPDRPKVTTFAAYVNGAEPPVAWPAVTPDDIALLQYTGGTTGLPKGAILTHGNLTAAVDSYDVWFAGQGMTKAAGEDRVICVLPLFHSTRSPRSSCAACVAAPKSCCACASTWKRPCATSRGSAPRAFRVCPPCGSRSRTTPASRPATSPRSFCAAPAAHPCPWKSRSASSVLRVSASAAAGA